MKENMMEFGLTPQLPYSVQEAVNRLRINISFTGSDMRKIMLVSSEPNEGKSFIAINLWNQMAEAGEKTVFLDADMRNSTVVNKYRLKRLDGKEIKGTSHLLAGNADLEEVLMHTKYGEDWFVFVDAPPLGLVSDAEKIGSLCDGAILCVRSGVTPKGIVRESIRQLERAGCPLLGIVLNRVDESKGGYGKYGHYGRYGKYYNEQYYGSSDK